MDNYLSIKIYFFSFWLIILVVLLHSLNIQFTDCNNLICSFQYLLSHKLTQIAVPLFFFISGFLYFFKADITKRIVFSFYVKNNKKRIRTVLIPYILWCLIWFVVLYIIQILPIVKNYFSQPLYTMNFNDTLLNLIVYPLNYPFWFLRELMLLFILSPLIFIFIKYFQKFFLFLVFLITLFVTSFFNPFGVNILQTIPILYFSLGAFFALNKKVLINEQNKFSIVILILIWIIFNLFSVYFDKELTLDPFYLRIFNVLKDLTGCYAVWIAYDYLNRNKQWKNYSFYQYSFFIFAFHGIPTIILVKLSEIFNKNQFYFFLSYVVIFVAVIFMSILTAKFAQFKTPKIYKILIGNR